MRGKKALIALSAIVFGVTGASSFARAHDGHTDDHGGFAVGPLG